MGEGGPMETERITLSQRERDRLKVLHEGKAESILVIWRVLPQFLDRINGNLRAAMAVGHEDFTQKKPDQLVYLELGVGNGGMLLTISEDGFRFRAVTPVRANTSMPFAFSLDGRNRLEGEGTVEWVEEDGRSGGLRFTEVSPEFHATLGAWLNSDVSHQAGREVTPDAATPLDTMEQIRQELRAGYPQRPADATPAARGPEQKPAPRAFPHAGAQKNVSEKSSPDKNFPEKNVTEKSLPAQNKSTIFARTSEKI